MRRDEWRADMTIKFDELRKLALYVSSTPSRPYPRMVASVHQHSGLVREIVFLFHSFLSHFAVQCVWSSDLDGRT